MAAKENLVDKVNKALGSGGSLAGTDKSYTTHYSRIAALLDKYTAVSAMVAEPDYMKHAQPKGHVRKFVHHALDHIGIKKRIRSYASPEAVSNALGEASQEQYRKAREGNRSY